MHAYLGGWTAMYTYRITILTFVLVSGCAPEAEMTGKNQRVTQRENNIEANPDITKQETQSADKSGLVLDPPTSQLPCSLQDSGRKIAYHGAGVAAMPFKVGLKTQVVPAGYFSLDKTPDTNSIDLKTFDKAGAARENSDFKVDGLKIILNTHLAPGERAEATYIRTPPQPDSNFILVGVASDGNYKVELIRGGVVESLVRGTSFEIEESDAGLVTLKLTNQVDPGATLVVRYTVSEDYSENTTEEEMPGQ